MSLIILFAQVAADPLSGGAGWVGSGLLGAVLAWILFVNLPNKDKQILGLVESRDKLVEKLTADFRQSLNDLINKSEIKDKELRADFKESLQKVTDHCEREVKAIMEVLKKEVDHISQCVEEIGKKISEEKKGG